MPITFEYKIAITTVSDGNLVPVTTGNYYLRRTPFDANTYTGTHLANGIWNFGNVEANAFQLFLDTDKVAAYGTRWIGDDTPVLNSLTMDGNIDLNGNNILNAVQIQVNALIEKKSAAGVTIDGVLIKDSLDVSGIVAKTGNQTIAGIKTWSGVQVWGSASLFSDYYPKMDFNAGYAAPTADYELTPKKYVDDEISTLSVTPYQESTNRVRVIPNGTEQTGKVYTTVASAIAYFGSPAATKQCTVDIISTGVASQYLTVNSSALVNYVHLRGNSNLNNLSGTAFAGLIISGSASVTKTMTFENLTLYFGANDIATDRTYNSMTFNNCVIFAWKNTTFVNCKFLNCIIYHTSGFKSTLTGGIVFNTAFNQETADDGNTKWVNSITDFDPSYSMPTDPSSGA